MNHHQHCHRAMNNRLGYNNPVSPWRHISNETLHSGDWPDTHMGRCGNCGIVFAAPPAHIITEGIIECGS